MGLARLALIVGIPILAVGLFSVFIYDLEVQAESNIKYIEVVDTIGVEDKVFEIKGKIYTIEIHDGVGTSDRIG